MPKKEPEHCTYSTVKLDDQLLHDARLVALMRHQSVQEWVSDLVNAAISQALGKPPLQRRKPKPRGHKARRPSD